MKKNYFYTILLAVFLVSLTASAQENKPQQPNKTQETTIEGLSFYPNPVSNGKVYITSKSSLAKEVTIFDILGKVVLQSTINTKELNVSSLSPGIYMIKIKEGDATATRKLIIR
ncbi:MAG TPA: T9SS type A sorting domain-containing protein [Flavobacterium sp.]|uniref:T9SS type A sorting domain-containing protein n=2 Tax=Flavobacterium TaxID=237 RepID=UPI0025C4C05B|nr:MULTISPECIES: T9SS type A sorting domain-containing protein [unclassified Flavobacterium]HRE77565.1 T9SS type A sorting domain-containing protein [Flavobacterium sp.]